MFNNKLSELIVTQGFSDVQFQAEGMQSQATTLLSQLLPITV